MRLWAVVLAASVLVASRADAETPLEKPSFTASPTDWLAAAKAAPVGDWPVSILREEHQIDVDDQGRATTRWRLVFVVRTQAGVDGWGTLTSFWSPFYQDKPVVRARVIEPGGKVANLDPSLITDAPAIETSPTVFSDRRRLEIPLPRLQIGAVVEEEIITKDRVALLAAGTVHQVSLGDTMPAESVLVTLSAPVRLKAKLVSRSLPKGLAPRRTADKTRETWSFRIAPRRASPELEGFVPSDTRQYPFVGLATGASWNAIARDYRKLVDARIAAGPVRLPDGLPTAPTLDTVRQLVAWLHREVRYTGIELGDASITPWPPAETLKRGFGDCKDKATLLVALLRQAGIRAELALLSTGPGLDIDVDLPGMGVFDHAIVHAKVEGRDVWIDATEDLYAVGAIPPRDQGRRALVIADGTRALQLTPKRTSADTVVREIRTYELAETGPARVTEVSREGGAYEVESRTWIRDSRSDEVRKNLEQYVGSEYSADTLEKFTTTPVAELSIPFETTVVAAASRRAYTNRGNIEVSLSPTDALAKLPKLLTSFDEKEPPRTHAFELYVPHIYEIENRLVLPMGYEPPTPAPERTRALGAMTLTERQELDGRTLIVTYRLDTGSRRMSPAELRAAQKAIHELAREETNLVIEHSGWALTERGKPREALAAVEQLAKLHPKEALHQTQLAFVLLRAGAGAAARRAARKAVELEPKDADAFAVLGWVLRHDTLGREYGFDHDRAGALAAYAKARKLNPKHAGAAHDHALLLERDAYGRLYGPGADLAGAEQAWRAARGIEDTEENALALVKVLLVAGKAAEAERIARGLAASSDRDPALVAATAVAQSPEAAVAVASSMRTGNARDQLLDGAAALLVTAREYDRARALFVASGATRAGKPQAVAMQKLKRHAGPVRLGADPRGAAHTVFYALFDPMFSSKVFWDAEVQERLEQGSNQFRTRALRELSSAVLWDLAQSMPEITVEGRKAGPWKVHVEALGRGFNLFVALDKGVVRVFAGSDYVTGLGRHAQRLLAAGDEAGARQCLDWARAEAGASGKAGPAARFWEPAQLTDKAAVALAAGVLGMDAAAVPVLEKCATKIQDARAACDVALTAALLEAKQWAELERHTAAWAARAPAELVPLAINTRGAALVQLGRLADAEKLYDEALATRTDNVMLLRGRISVAVSRGHASDALRRFATLIKLPGATAIDKNNYAWLRVTENTELPAALELARAAVREEGRSSHARNTLAVVAAELGDLGLARTEGWEAMEVGGRVRPDDADLYLIGRLYEQLGLRGDAIAVYRRVSPPKIRDGLPHSADLARKRLAALGVK